MLKIGTLIRSAVTITILSLLFCGIFIISEKACSGIQAAVLDKISKFSGKFIVIGKTRISPLLSFSLENIQVYNDPYKKAKALNIDKATFQADIVSIFTAKKLDLTIDIGAITVFPTISGQGIVQEKKKEQEKRSNPLTNELRKSLHKAFDIRLFIDSISLSDPESFRNSNLARELSADILIEKDPLSIEHLACVLFHRDNPYSLSLSRKQNPANGYLITLATNNLKARADIDINGKDLVINTVSGNYGPVDFGMKGDITGSRLSLRDLAWKSLKIDELSSDIYYDHGIFSMPDIRAKGIKINGSLVGDVSSSLSMESGVIELSRISMPFYGGEISADIVIGLKSAALPFNVFSSIRNMNCNSFFADMSKKPSRINGVLNSDFNLNGYLRNPSEVKGSGKVSINNAYLGPTAFPAPFIGTIYSTIQQMVMPSEIAAITSAEAVFSISGNTIYSDNVIFHGDNVYITGSGKAKFSGELDFSFQNQLTNSSHMDQSITDNLFRIPTAGLGKKISNARLTGTAKTPKWDFEYVYKDIFRENLQKLI